MDYIRSFDIRLEKTIYYPGELISGCIILDNCKDIEIQNIFVALRGKAVAYLKTIRGNDRKIVTDYQYLLNHSKIVLGKEFEIVERKESLLKSDRKNSTNNQSKYESQSTTILSKGSHIFDFSFNLKKENLPCSLETKYCTIRYYIKVIINISKNTSPQGIKYITIIGPQLDCMEEKYMSSIISQDHRLKCLRFCQRGSIGLRMNLRRCAYVGGENLWLRADIENWQHFVVYLKIRLYQNVEIRIDKRNYSEQKLIQSLAMEYRSNAISESSRYNFDSTKEYPIKIPVLPPTMIGNCRLIQIYYTLKVCLEDENQKEDLFLDFPIVIGTIPYRYPPSMQGTISYEFCIPFVEGGKYISPEFKLGDDINDEQKLLNRESTILTLNGDENDIPKLSYFEGNLEDDQESEYDYILYRPVYVKYNEKINEKDLGRMRIYSINEKFRNKTNSSLSDLPSIIPITKIHQESIKK
ncbi:FI21816p1 [Strongyloides ratti]|uniref:FI21816p1 n=1 Tax=Strongyloides ratti TaxID=34506 RepID=A0A090LNG2_STRRB|nr:FI21816p1 [Strongyloides ratti]CEF71410.1 FI21816p1 [Strongyloides ratti]